ncbi:hypothetical protein D9M69_726070 [compost metagenome]
MSAPSSALSGAQAIEPPASAKIQTAMAAMVTRITGPANASYLRIISMPKLTMTSWTIQRNTKAAQPRVDSPRMEFESISFREGTIATSMTLSTTDAR